MLFCPASTSPLNRPCVESYLSKYAKLSDGTRSFMATISTLEFLFASRKTILPIRPKPLIAILTDIYLLIFFINFNKISESPQLLGSYSADVPAVSDF